MFPTELSPTGKAEKKILSSNLANLSQIEEIRHQNDVIYANVTSQDINQSNEKLN